MFKKIGKNVKVYPLAKIINPEVISIGDHVIIDDFVFIMGGARTVIGNYAHIASFCSVAGGGEFIMDDFSGLSSGCRIFTGSDDFSGTSLTNPAIPPEFREVKRSFVSIKRHAILGPNVVVLPGVTIGEGTAVLANSVIRKDTEPWSIMTGNPVRIAMRRPKEKILEMEKRLYGSIKPR
ncbi:acyltransferase [Candidatus Omnitrophota bacterium]